MDEQERKPHRIIEYCAWIIGALVVYVASIGPAAFFYRLALYRGNFTAASVIQFAHRPLMPIDSDTAVGSILCPYID